MSVEVQTKAGEVICGEAVDAKGSVERSFTIFDLDFQILYAIPSWQERKSLLKSESESNEKTEKLEMTETSSVSETYSCSHSVCRGVLRFGEFSKTSKCCRKGIVGKIQGNIYLSQELEEFKSKTFQKVCPLEI